MREYRVRDSSLHMSMTKDPEIIPGSILLKAKDPEIISGNIFSEGNGS